MSNASVAINSARVCLGDLNGITWTDSILFPNLQEAYRSMLLSLRVYSINVLKKQSAIILVPAGTPSLNSLSSYPANLLNPISMYERFPGSDLNSFEPMERLTFIPLNDPIAEIDFWAWEGEQILLALATTDREILLRYEGTLTPPNTLNDPLNFIMAESYLGPKTAAVALNAISKDGSKWDARAEAALYEIVKVNITEDQRPTRRRGYRSHKGFYGPEGISSVLVAGGGSSGGGTQPVNWILTTTPADGNRTTFNFAFLPKYISWNGLNQFQGTGYTMALINGVYVVTFIDAGLNVLTPAIGDDIRAEIN